MSPIRGKLLKTNDNSKIKLIKKLNKTHENKQNWAKPPKNSKNVLKLPGNTNEPATKGLDKPRQAGSPDPKNPRRGSVPSNNNLLSTTWKLLSVSVYWLWYQWWQWADHSLLFQLFHSLWPFHCLNNYSIEIKSTDGKATSLILFLSAFMNKNALTTSNLIWDQFHW